MKKRLCKRALSAALVLVLLLPHPGTAARAAQSSGGEAGRGAFGLPEASGLTEGSAEHAEAVQSAPYGSSGNVVPLFVKSELYMTYGWSGGKRYTHVFDYNRDNTDGELANILTDGDTFESLENEYRTKFSTAASSASLVVDTAAVNAGSGKQEYVAVLGLGKGNSYLELRDKNDAPVSNSLSLGAKSYLTDYAFELGGFAAVAAGDFDGDGVDSVVYYNPPTAGYNDGHISEALVTVDSGGAPVLTADADAIRVIPNIYDVFGSAGKGTAAKDIPVVQLEAADVDKDGYDELIVTLGRNDVSSGDILCGTQVHIYDKLDTGWTLTAHYAPTAASGAFAMNSYEAAGAAKRYVWSTSSVGNVIVSDDSSTGTDFPEIVTAGWIDISMDASSGKNIAVDESTLGVTLVRCVGMTEAHRGQANYQGNYELVYSRTLTANSFTSGGFYEEDDRNSLLQVKCFRHLGGAQAEAVFLSGSVYTWTDGSGSGSLDHQYTYDYYTENDKYIGSAKLSNKQIQSVAAGNFDGNKYGREQVVFANLVKKNGSTEHYVSFYVYDCAAAGETNEWRGSEVDGWPVSGKDGAFVSLTDFDCDNDGILVKFKSVERQWENCDILAILEPQPYFAELGDDLGEGHTSYGTSRSSGSGSGHSHGLNTTVVTGFEMESALTHCGGGFELTIENNFTWSTNVSCAEEHSITYENQSGETLVVVYRVPVLFYTYENVSNDNDMVVAKTLPPETASVTVENYNAEAKANDLPTIDESKLVTAGDPFSYPSNTMQIKNAGGTDITVSQTDWTLLSDTNTEKSISITTETESAFEYELSINVLAWGTNAGWKLGAGAGYTYTHNSSKMNGTGTEYSGSVHGPVADGYSFAWNFAMWNMEVGGKKVPVLGYLVKDAAAPASPPTDVDVRYDTMTASSATLTWTQGARPAAEYRIYRVMGDGSAAYLTSVSGGASECTIGGLGENMTYTFLIRALRDGVESVDSESVSFTTPRKNGTSYVTVGKVADREVNTGGSTVFSAVVTKNDPNAILSMQWQKRAPGTGEWADIAGADGNALTVSEAGLSQDGTKYRLRVAVITLQENNPVYYFSNAAALHVGALETSVGAVSVTAPETDIPGSGTPGNPFSGLSNWSLAGTASETITVEEPYTYQTDDGTGTVYACPDAAQTRYLGVRVSENGEKTYDSVVYSEEEDAFSESGSQLSVLYKDSAGSVVPDMKAEYASGILTQTDGEAVYYAVAARSGAAVELYWEKDGAYYTYDAESGYVPAEAAPEYLVCYHAEDEGIWLLRDILDDTRAPEEGAAEEGAAAAYFTLIKGTSVTENILTEGYLTQDGAEIDLSELVVHTKPVTESITVDTLTPQSGTELTLSAAVTSDGSALAGQSGFFLITNTADGTSSRLEGTSDANGVLACTWTAPAAGLYSIRAGVNASESYRASASGDVYYAALEKDTDAEVQPTTYVAARVGDADGAYAGTSAVYGTALYFETYTASAVGTVTSSGPAESLTLPDGTVQTLANGCSAPDRAGQYAAASAEGGRLTFTVTPRRLTVTPALTATVPETIADLSLTLTGALAGDEAALQGLLSVKDEDGYFGAGGGVFTFAPVWSEEEADTAEIQRLRSAYSVTFESLSLRRELGKLPVVYQAAASGHGTLYAFCGNRMTSFASGTEMAEGTKLVFQANPEEGYCVESWTVNGAAVAEDDALYRIEKQDGSNRQTLTLDSLSVTGGDRLTVQVSFTEQFSTVNFSAGKNGALRAQTAAGTQIASGTKLTFGSSVTFTAAPADGCMVAGWTVNGQAYCWTGTAVPYQETTLTLSGLSLASYDVAVSFAPQRVFTAAAPEMADAGGTPVTSGSITMTDAVSGAAVAAGSSVTQGTVLTYTAAFADAGFNTVSRWEYSTDGGTSWQSGGSGASFTLYTAGLTFGENAALRVRAVISVAETRTIRWSIDENAPEEAGALLTAASGSVTLTNGGSYPVGTPVTFTLTLDARYQAAWSENVTPSPDGLSAAMTLSADSEITVTVTAKPVTPAQDILTPPALPEGSSENAVSILVAGGGFITDGLTENEITVTSAELTCVVIVVSTDESGNVTYRRIAAAPVDGSDGTYRFKTTLAAGETILTAVKGDIPVDGKLDGRIGNAEILQIKRAANQDSWTESELAWVDVYGNDGKINNKDILIIKRAANGAQLAW